MRRGSVLRLSCVQSKLTAARLKAVALPPAVGCRTFNGVDLSGTTLDQSPGQEWSSGKNRTNSSAGAIAAGPRHTLSASSVSVSHPFRPRSRPMPVMSGLSGNEMYCLHLKGLAPGDLVIGNSVYSMGFVGASAPGFGAWPAARSRRSPSDPRRPARKPSAHGSRKPSEHGGHGITGVTSELKSLPRQHRIPLRRHLRHHAESAAPRISTFPPAATGRNSTASSTPASRRSSSSSATWPIRSASAAASSAASRAWAAARSRNSATCSTTPGTWPCSGWSTRPGGRGQRRRRHRNHRDAVPGRSRNDDDGHRLATSRAARGVRRPTRSPAI